MQKVVETWLRADERRRVGIRKERRMMYIIAGIFGGIVIALFLHPYFSNSGIPKAIDELTKEVRELRKTITERSEDDDEQ